MNGEGRPKTAPFLDGRPVAGHFKMNSPFLDAARWDAEVAKMIKAFGAPIDPADAKTIGAYLKQNYGE